MRDREQPIAMTQCLLHGPLVTPHATAVLLLQSSLSFRYFLLLSFFFLLFLSLNFDHWEDSSRSFELRNVFNAKDLATGSVNKNRTNLPVIIITQAAIRVYSHFCAGARLALAWPNYLWENSDTHLSNRASRVCKNQNWGLKLVFKIIAKQKVS